MYVYSHCSILFSLFHIIYTCTYRCNYGTVRMMINDSPMGSGFIVRMMPKGAAGACGACWPPIIGDVIGKNRWENQQPSWCLKMSQDVSRCLKM